MKKSVEKLLNPQDAIEKSVASWVSEWVDIDDASPIEIRKACLEALRLVAYEGGVKSGCVNTLIYYKQTTSFFERNKEIIARYLREDNLKADELNEWDADDFFVESHGNKNVLAWYAFERAAGNILGRIE
jgi:hypothetical protein